MHYVPDDYLNVLPSMPFPGPVVKKCGLGNATEGDPADEADGPAEEPAAGAVRRLAVADIEKMTAEDVHLATDEDLARMGDEQVDAWMGRYVELLRKQSQTSSHTSPPASDAQPTPAGQANPTAEAASVGSLGLDVLPQATAT